MLLYPYNVKSAELAAPFNRNEDYRDQVGYIEYKDLYDKFRVSITPLACIEWRDDDLPQEVRDFWAPQWEVVNGLIERLVTCKYVVTTVYKNHKHGGLTYRRLLEEEIRGAPLR